MRWFGVGLGVGLLMLIAGYATGLFLPNSYNASASRVIDAPRAKVWAAIEDYKDNPVSGRMAHTVTPLEGDGKSVVWVEDIGSSQLTVRNLSTERYEVLTREARDSVVPMFATITIRLGDRDGKTAIHVSNQTIINNGTWHVPLFRLNFFFTNALEQGIEEYLDRLEADLESHETPAVTAEN